MQTCAAARGIGVPGFGNEAVNLMGLRVKNLFNLGSIAYRTYNL